MKNNVWNDITPTKYDHYAEQYPFYQKLSRFLVEMSGVKKGMRVVDLACGTGITTAEILKKIGPQGKVIGVDYSKGMLAVARRSIRQKNVFFVLSPAEGIAEAVKEEVDLVVCSSAFFIMDTGVVLEGVKKLLKKEGKFVFNLPKPYWGFWEGKERLSRPVFLSQIERFLLKDSSIKFPEKLKGALSFPMQLKITMQKIVIGRYGLTIDRKKKKSGILLDFQRIKKILERKSFEIERYESLNIERTPQEYYSFLEIPIVTKGILPSLGYSERMKVLKEAYSRIERPSRFKEQWFFIVSRKSEGL